MDCSIQKKCMNALIEYFNLLWLIIINLSLPQFYMKSVMHLGLV